MSLVGRVSFSPEQSRIFRINYPWLTVDETVVTVTPTITPDDGLFTVTNVVIAADGKSMQFMANGNGVVEDGSEYDVSVLAVTSDAQRNVDCINFQIQDGC